MSSIKSDFSFGHLGSATVYVKNFRDNDATWAALENYAKKIAYSETDRNIIIIFFFDTEDCPPLPIDSGHSICNRASVRIALSPKVIEKEGYNKHYIALYYECPDGEETFIKHPAPLKSILDN